MRKIMCVLFILTAVLTSGTHCNNQPHPVKTGAPSTPFNPPAPRPHPDHGPKTPQPKPADPEPHYEHTCSIFVSWSPAKLFVEIDWEPNGPLVVREHSGGTFSRNLKVYGDGRCSVQAVWTDLSNKNKATPPGDLTCLVTFDGQVSGSGRDTIRGPGGSVYCEDSAR